MRSVIVTLLVSLLLAITLVVSQALQQQQQEHEALLSRDIRMHYGTGVHNNIDRKYNKKFQSSNTVMQIESSTCRDSFDVMVPDGSGETTVTEAVDIFERTVLAGEDFVELMVPLGILLMIATELGTSYTEVVTKETFMWFCIEPCEEVFAEVDTNSDGVLTEYEFFDNVIEDSIVGDFFNAPEELDDECGETVVQFCGPSLSPQQSLACRNVFDDMDLGGTGEITADEAVAMLNETMMTEDFGDLTVTLIWMISAEFGQDNNAVVTEETFIWYCTATCEEQFAAIDTDGDGLLTDSEFFFNVVFGPVEYLFDVPEEFDDEGGQTVAEFCGSSLSPQQHIVQYHSNHLRKKLDDFIDGGAYLEYKKGEGINNNHNN